MHPAITCKFTGSTDCQGIKENNTGEQTDNENIEKHLILFITFHKDYELSMASSVYLPLSAIALALLIAFLSKICFLSLSNLSFTMTVWCKGEKDKRSKTWIKITLKIIHCRHIWCKEKWLQTKQTKKRKEKRIFFRLTFFKNINRSINKNLVFADTNIEDYCEQK